MKKATNRSRRSCHRSKGDVPRKPSTEQQDLLTQIVRMDNLRRSFKKVKENRGSHGSDKISVKMVEDSLDETLLTLQEALMNGEYLPAPLRRVAIPKDNGKERIISIPTVIDRIAQQAVLSTVEPLFEQVFLPCNHGFRPSLGTETAMEEVLTLIKEGYHYVIKGDITGCFDHIPKALLLQQVKANVTDYGALNIISKMIQQGTAGTAEDHVEGIPQGGVISPLLANVYLHQLDSFADTRGFRLIRYADDWVMMFRTERDARVAREHTEAYITHTLHLTSKDKETEQDITYITSGFNFLGYTFYEGGRKPSDRAINRFRLTLPLKIDKALNKSDAAGTHYERSLSNVIAAANPFIEGWGQYYTRGNGRSILRNLDAYIRGTIREIAAIGGRRTNHSLYQEGLFSLERLHIRNHQ
ncbi:group II intron reverse transcriptase/maturase [Brevibacillus reuszeri]|uniref:group II intron reverse transcriptase/maturase n=1 Tax=Brevibacillus reuszeri TaxID=54915 RepID=UPI003D244AF6